MRNILLIFALLIALGLMVERWNKVPGAVDMTEEGWHQTETVKPEPGVRSVAVGNTGGVTRRVSVPNIITIDYAHHEIHEGNNSSVEEERSWEK